MALASTVTQVTKIGLSSTSSYETGNISAAGIITATKFIGDGSGITGVTASGSGVGVKDSDSVVGTAGTINFGSNLTVSAISAGIVTVTASGGGGSALTIAEEGSDLSTAATKLNFVGSNVTASGTGATKTITVADRVTGDPETIWTLTASGNNHYVFAGNGFPSGTNDPTLYLIRGQTYKFTNNTGGHPFRIQTDVATSGGGTQYNSGVTNNDASGASSQTLIFVVPMDAPATLYYQCTAHPAMTGTINILNATDNNTDTFVGLTDTPANYTSQAGKFIRVNSGASGLEYATVSSGGLGNVVEDTTPQLGGDLDINGKDLVTTSNGDIEIDPHGSGVTIFKGNATKGSGQIKLNCEQNSHAITLKGPPHSAAATYTLTFPDDDGGSGTYLKSDGSGNLSWDTPSGGSGINNVVEDTTPQLGGNLDVNGKDIVSVSNGDIEIDPHGSGVTIFKGNATKGSGQFKLNCEQNSHAITIKGPPHSAAATYTLTLPNDDGGSGTYLKSDGSGNLSWDTPSGGGSGISNVVEDTTPQLGGNLDLNSKEITGTGGINITGIITSTNLGIGTDSLSTRVDIKSRDTGTVSTFTMNVTNNGTSHYTFSSATDRNGANNGDDPTINIRVGDTIQITNNAASGHPLWLKTVQGTGTGNPVSTPAATNNGGSSNGVVVSWTPNTPGTYYYNCQHHSGMTGEIVVESTISYRTQIALEDHDSENKVWRVGQQSDNDGFMQILQTGITYTMDVTNNGFSHYTFSNATDRNGAANGDDPALTFRVGDLIKITTSAGSSHPFWIKRIQSTGSSNQASGVVNNGATSGTVSWSPTTPGTYYYNCGNHSNMTGTITVVEVPAAIQLDSSGTSWIDNGANFGIGLLNPAEKLEVDGTIQCLNQLKSSSGNDLILNTGSANRDVKIQVNGSNMLYVKGDTGRIGIGTITPEEVLDVRKNLTGAVRIRATNDSVASSSYSSLALSNPKGMWSIYTEGTSTASNYLKFWHSTNSGANLLYIESTGNVGINRNDPQEKLDVNGHLRLASVQGTNTAAECKVLYQHNDNVIHGGSSLNWNPANDTLSVNGNAISSTVFRGAGSTGTLTCANHSSTTHVQVTDKIELKGKIKENIVMDTSKGIDFTNATDEATGESTTSSVFDDYEEGTFTMTQIGSGGGLTLTNNVIRYTKVGNLVHVSGMVDPTVVSGSSNVELSLPYTSASDSGTTKTRSTGALMYKNVNMASSTEIGAVAYIGQNEAYMRVYFVQDNGDWGQMNTSDLSTSSEIFFTVTYRVS